MISALSRISYRWAELIDAFVIFSDKFNKSLSYRKQWRNAINPAYNQESLWIHGASVGELEDLASFFTDKAKVEASGFSLSQLVLTSSSVSAAKKLRGFQEKTGCAYAGPIPPEKLSDCKEFFKALRPKVLVMSHSDVWPCLMKALQDYGHCQTLWLPVRVKEITLIQKSALLGHVKTIGLRALDENFDCDKEQSFVGNPRIDRIHERIEAQKAKMSSHILKRFHANPKKEKFSLLMGSAWKEDATFASQALRHLSADQRDKLQIVVIPHEPNDSHEVASIKNALPDSDLVLEEGILLEAYQDFSMAWVGGGFRSGLHSILEPALWEMPVVVGPEQNKQPESRALAASGLLYSFQSPQDLALFLGKLIDDLSFRADIQSRCKDSCVELKKHLGASDRISKLIKAVAS